MKLTLDGIRVIGQRGRTMELKFNFPAPPDQLKATTMKLNRIVILMCASLALVSITARADEPADPLAERLFPPDLILQNGEAIGLSDEKRQEIVSRMEKAQ